MFTVVYGFTSTQHIYYDFSHGLLKDFNRAVVIYYTLNK